MLTLGEGLGIGAGVITITGSLLTIWHRVWFADVKQQQALDRQWRENVEKAVLPGLVEDFEEQLNGFGVRLDRTDDLTKRNASTTQAHENQLTEIRGKLDLSAADRGGLRGELIKTQAEVNDNATELRRDSKAVGEAVAELRGRLDELRRLVTNGNR